MSQVFVGLSGGVDSAVAAAILKDQGHSITGVYMKNWSKDVAGHHCPWKEDLASARSVAAYLEIPLKVYDFEKEYFQSVTHYMIESYKSGITPNPDVMCNQKIKFDAFFHKCTADGADLVATGHYAIMAESRLQKAKDSNKDQSYFLYRIDPHLANQILFPLGGLEKPMVRELARKYNLPNHDRPDSQGLCFVGNIPMRDFLSEYVSPQKGQIVDEQGTKLGEHMGAFAYTIGQRQGLGIGGGKPYYVYAIDTTKNLVMVTHNEKSPLLNSRDFAIRDTVWWQSPEKVENLMVKIRYRSESVACILTPGPDASYIVKLAEPAWAITPGQSAVFYMGEVVVGGGVII